MFLEKDKQFKLAEVEEEVLKFWEKEQIFEKSLARRKGKKPFVFYEGPPTANGRPGIHHILARCFKDIIPRFKTMQGYYVGRKGGWDTHGLPVELEVEKKMSFKSKKDIEAFGIAEFNKKCKESVWEYKEEWEKLTKRIGFWLDTKNPYITYDPDYVESLWWVIAQIYKKGYLYKGHRVAPWCVRCGTTLSSHELAQGYKEDVDRSVYVKFKLNNEQRITNNFTTDDKTYILAWTTTPWTLPGNVALAVGENIDYSIWRVKNSHTNKVEVLIFATDLVNKVFDNNIFLHTDGSIKGHVISGPPGGEQKEYSLIERIKGKDLVDLEYEPLFDVPALQNEKSHRIYPADFVTTTDGTGVVHTAVMYGEDDYQLGVKIGLPQHHTVDESGKFTNEVKELAGMSVVAGKAKNKETEDVIVEYLKKKNLLLAQENYKHEYPHCWRCDTPVLYYARSSWFIAMSKLRNELMKRNKTINWVPAHLKEGRFGSWLEEVKDWNFSRERYWGTPLPIWECKECNHRMVFESRKEIAEHGLPSKNQYWTLRHGQSDTQILKIADSGTGKYHLTKKGRGEVEKSVKALQKELAKKKEKIDLIISSDILRTQETSRIASEILGVKVEFEPRLREINTGTFSGKSVNLVHKYASTYEEDFEKPYPEGECLRDVRKRMWSLIQDLEKEYKGKNLLIISHEYPIWMFAHVMNGWTETESIQAKIKRGRYFINTGEIQKRELVTASRNDDGEYDPHRPYIDAVVLQCEKCSGKAHRIKELADVWFDSGAMPFASAHFPFAEAKNSKFKIQNSKLGLKGLEYPADYICEAMDQTRGWFYTLLAVSTLLGKPAPYKNVISLGLIHDKFGQKMSKSRGNTVNPWETVDKFGVDAVRWYFYSSTPAGEPTNFDPDEIVKATRRYHLLLLNSWVFYDTYGPKVRQPAKKIGKKKSVLDQWIVARLEETIEVATKKLEAYDVREAALSLESFLDDLSRWYIRRSRRRLQKPESQSNYKEASETLGQMLYAFSILTAPFTPFFGEFLYHQLEPKKIKDSIHFVDWPTSNKKLINRKLITEMAEVRRVAALALAKRAELGIKVRQPLGQVKVNSKNRIVSRELMEILKDEINVKEIAYDKNLKEEILLDPTITEELREEGLMRELIRQVQDLRQKAGTKPGDKIELLLELSDDLKAIIQKNEEVLKLEVGAKGIRFERLAKTRAESEAKIDAEPVWFGIR